MLDAEAVTATPKDVEPVVASTLALNALTVHQALQLLDLAEGQTLLVTGAAGAVGGYAIELAKLRGLTIVAVAGAATPPPLRGITVHTVYVGANASQLVALVESGRLSPRVADTYPLADATTAYERAAEGGVRGRIVLVP